MNRFFYFILTLFHSLFRRTKFKSHTNKLGMSSKLYDCEVGSYNYFGPNVVINNAKIGNFCSIAPNVIIGGMEHDYTNYSTSTRLFPHQRRLKTIIEDDVWIAANSCIKTGVTIGRGSVIGANSTVLIDVPPLSIVVGSPAKTIKSRFNDQKDTYNYNNIDFTEDIGVVLKKIEEFRH